MALNGAEFAGYWDANLNRVLGRVNSRLFDTPNQLHRYYLVKVAGSTSLGGNTNWQVGDIALHTGFEWCRILGPAALAGGITAFFNNLPTTPPAVPGFWLDGGVLIFS